MRVNYLPDAVTLTSRPEHSFVVDTLDDIFDGDFSAGKLSLREAIHFANILPGADTITFAPVIAGGTITLTGGQLVLTDAAETIIDGGERGTGHHYRR